VRSFGVPQNFAKDDPVQSSSTPFHLPTRLLRVFLPDMGLRSLLWPRGQLKRHWRFVTPDDDTVVWKLLISPEGILAGEERNVKEHTATLFALDVDSGETLWRGMAIEEPWWFGSERISRDVIVLHHFPKPDMPDPRGITVLDPMTGRMLWNDMGLTYLLEHDGKLYAMRNRYGMKEYLELDARTGETIESYGTDLQRLAAPKMLSDVSDPNSVFSTPLGEESEIFPTLKDLLQSTIGAGEVRGTIDYAEFGKYLIFSYHERITDDANAMLQNLLTNELRVLDREKNEVVYAETLNARTPFPVPDNFFINRGILIYVKEKRELTGIKLQ
jgi:hypothetical protein